MKPKHKQNYNKQLNEKYRKNSTQVSLFYNTAARNIHSTFIVAAVQRPGRQEMKTRNEVKKTRKEVKKTRNEVKKTRKEVKKMRNEVKKTRNEVKKTRKEVKKTRNEVKKTRKEVKKTRNEVKKTRNEDEKWSEEDKKWSEEDKKGSEEDKKGSEDDKKGSEEDKKGSEVKKTRKEVKKTRKEVKKTRKEVKKTRKEVKKTLPPSAPSLCVHCLLPGPVLMFCPEDDVTLSSKTSCQSEQCQTLCRQSSVFILHYTLTYKCSEDTGTMCGWCKGVRILIPGPHDVSVVPDNNNNNNRIQRRYSRFFTISS